MLVTDEFLYVTGDHTGEHHAECHESGTNGVMCGLLLPFTEEHHEEGKGSKTESVAELFEGNTGGDQPHVGRAGKREIHVHEVG